MFRIFCALGAGIVLMLELNDIVNNGGHLTSNSVIELPIALFMTILALAPKDD